ncbi:unnamed protein product [Oppiella nova]|uniref:Uncharacterized protein n=1 Tax=Oppiella nova TaxID=334625 RepID=A0A7R9QAU8_9ACAR|nr:unnamed protein product [Oppiella nova]CAG2161514.1 unnamed protein product [Oppiella nova]
MSLHRDEETDDSDRILQAFVEGDKTNTILKGALAKVPISTVSKLGKTCFKDIGCYSGVKFKEVGKGFNHLPLSPQKINPVFFLYTLNNTRKGRILRYNPKKKDMEGTGFDPRFPTFILPMGFLVT